MRGKERVGGAVESARPYVERLARDEELHDHVKKAYDSARRIYDELIGDRGTTVLFELPDVACVLEDVRFWDLYYEHCSYFSLGSMARLFRASARRSSATAPPT